MTVIKGIWRRLCGSHRKYAVGLLGVLTQAVTLGLLHGTALHAVQLAIAVLTAEGVRVAENTPTEDTPVGAED